MSLLKNIIRLLDLSASERSISKQLGVHRRTVHSCKQMLSQEELSYGAALELDDTELSELEHKYKPRGTCLEDERFANAMTFIVKKHGELHRTGVTRQLLWQEYIKDKLQGNYYSYSQFCFYVERYAQRDNSTARFSHEQGKYLQLDFAGDKLYYLDTHTLTKVSCEVLVATLPYSNYTVALALPSQNQIDFTNGIATILHAIGGCPKLLKLDNLKSGVIKPDRYEPTFNELLLQVAHHYKMGLDTARVAKPKDKPSVENAVAQVYRHAHAKLRDEVFYSLGELNNALQEKICELNKQHFQKKEGSRQSWFEQERLALQALPSTQFEVLKTRQAKVSRDCSVMLGEDHHYYTVPYTMVGKQVSVQYNQTLVRIYDGTKLIATHARNCKRYGRSINEEHYNPKHTAYIGSLSNDSKYYLSEAQRIGEHARIYVDKLLKSCPHQEMAYGSCKGFFRLVTTYGATRVEQACTQVKDYNISSYKIVKNILENNTKLGTGQSCSPAAHTSSSSSIDHNNIRGAQHYQ